MEIQISQTLVVKERYFTAVIRDITNRKQQEALLLQQRDELKQQNQKFLRANHFFQFTLDTMEMVINDNSDVNEILVYIEQVRKTLDELK